MTKSDWPAAEAALGRVIPEQCRSSVTAAAGLEVSTPNAYAALWPLSDVLRFNRDDAYGLATAFPGLLLIGTAGGSELVAVDLNRSGEPVVILNMISSSWDDVSDQGRPLDGWSEHLRAGGSVEFG